MKQLLIGTGALIVGFAMLGALYQANKTHVANTNTGTNNNDPVMCTMEAKMCPDGKTYVGRQGPKCEFAACPATPATSTPVTNGNVILAVGQVGRIGDLSIVLNAVSADSRCAVDVQCIWAGAVTVNVTLSDLSHTEQRNLATNADPYTFGKNTISITSVTPAPKSKKQILPKDYKITFHVEGK